MENLKEIGKKIMQRLNLNEQLLGVKKIDGYKHDPGYVISFVIKQKDSGQNFGINLIPPVTDDKIDVAIEAIRLSYIYKLSENV